MVVPVSSFSESSSGPGNSIAAKRREKSSISRPSIQTRGLSPSRAAGGATGSYGLAADTVFTVADAVAYRGRSWEGERIMVLLAGEPLDAAAWSAALDVAGVADRYKDESSYVELELPSSPEGVYVLLGEGDALLVKTDPPLRLRPLPLLLPAGRSSLYVKLADWRWGAKELDLVGGETVRVQLDWRK